MTGPMGMMVTLHVTPDDRGSYWAGWIEEMGTYVYADNMASLFPRAQGLFNLLVRNIDSKKQLLDYLDRRGIVHRDIGAGRSEVQREIPVLV